MKNLVISYLAGGNSMQTSGSPGRGLKITALVHVSVIDLFIHVKKKSKGIVLKKGLIYTIFLLPKM